MEQTCSSKEVISHACKLGKQYFETRECDEMSNVPMNHQGKVIACTSKQVYSGGQFMLFEESPLLGDELSDTDCKIHRRQNDIHFGVSQNKNGGKAGSIEMAENSATLNCRQNKEDQMKLYEDLGLEYCNIRHNSSGNPSDQEKVGISEIPKSEVMKMVATIYEPLSYKARCSLIHEHHLGDASFVSDSFSGQGMDKEIMPAATSADDLNTICLKGCKDMNTGNIGEKRFCAFVQRPDYASYVKSPINKKSSCNDGSKSLTEHDPENQQGIHNENQFCNTEVKSQIDSEEFVMDTLALNNNAVQIYKDVHILQEQSPTTESTVFHTDDLEDSSTDASEDSFYTVYSTNSIDDNFQSDAMLKFFKLTSSIKVNQSVDVTSDFRDCCTSSKATCVETSVVSRGNNTEISLYNSYVVKEWESESCRSVGCNTDKSYIREEVQEVGCQTIWVDAQENPIVADLAPVEITSLIQGSLRTKINEYSIDLKEPADGNFTNEKTELVSSLFTSLAELEARYKIMKEKLLRGTSLEALLPLFMEVNTKTTDVPYTPSMLACNSDNNSPFQNISSIVLEGAQCQENEKNDVKVISPMNESKEQFYVHVGSLHPSVSEAEVRSLFQRYDVSEVLIHEYSTKKSFAFLTFKTARQAEMAVEEMDGKHIHGKNIKVCLIQVAREAVSSTVGTSPILPSPEHKVIFGKNIEEKVVSSTSPGFSVLPDSSTTDLTIAPNLMTVVSSDPNVSGMALSDLQTGTVSTTNMVHCKAPTSCTIANSGLSTNSSVPAKAVPKSSLPFSSSLPTMSAPNASLPSNCSQPAWAMHSSCIVPWMVPNTGPASWQMTNSYPPSWQMNSSVHQCWWVPCSSQCPWPIPCSSQAPWLMPCTTQTPWPISCSSEAPWSVPCPSPATWPRSSTIKSPGMLKTIPTITSKSSFSAPQVTVANVLSQESKSALGSSRATYTSLPPSKAIVPAPYKGTNSVEVPCFAPSAAMATTEVCVSSSKVTSCVTSQFSTVTVSVPSMKIDSPVSAPAKARGSVFSTPSKAMFSEVSCPSKVIGSSVCTPSKTTTDLSKGFYSALASSTLTGTSHGSSAPKFIFVLYENQNFEDYPIQLRPVRRIPNVCGIYKSQNYMMVNNFSKLMKKMTKLHPTADRDKVKELVHMVAIEDNCMPADSILERVSLF